jgi:hypothetical protein
MKKRFIATVLRLSVSQQQDQSIKTCLFGNKITEASRFRKNEDIPEYQHPAKKAYRGNGGRGPHIHKFTIRWRWVVKYHTLVYLFPKKKKSTSLYFMRMGKYHSWSGWCGDQKHSIDNETTGTHISVTHHFLGYHSSKFIFCLLERTTELILVSPLKAEASDKT